MDISCKGLIENHGSIDSGTLYGSKLANHGTVKTTLTFEELINSEKGKIESQNIQTFSFENKGEIYTYQGYISSSFFRNAGSLKADYLSLYLKEFYNEGKLDLGNVTLLMIAQKSSDFIFNLTDQSVIKAFNWRLISSHNTQDEIFLKGALEIAAGDWSQVNISSFSNYANIKQSNLNLNLQNFINRGNIQNSTFRLNSQYAVSFENYGDMDQIRLGIDWQQSFRWHGYPTHDYNLYLSRFLNYGKIKTQERLGIRTHSSCYRENNVNYGEIFSTRFSYEGGEFHNYGTLDTLEMLGLKPPVRDEGIIQIWAHPRNGFKNMKGGIIKTLQVKGLGSIYGNYVGIENYGAVHTDTTENPHWFSQFYHFHNEGFWEGNVKLKAEGSQFGPPIDLASFKNKGALKGILNIQERASHPVFDERPLLNEGKIIGDIRDNDNQFWERIGHIELIRGSRIGLIDHLHPDDRITSHGSVTIHFKSSTQQILRMHIPYKIESPIYAQGSIRLEIPWKYRETIENLNVPLECSEAAKLISGEVIQINWPSSFINKGILQSGEMGVWINSSRFTNLSPLTTPTLTNGDTTITTLHPGDIISEGDITINSPGGIHNGPNARIVSAKKVTANVPISGGGILRNYGTIAGQLALFMQATTIDRGLSGQFISGGNMGILTSGDLDVTKDYVFNGAFAAQASGNVTIYDDLTGEVIDLNSGMVLLIKNPIIAQEACRLASVKSTTLLPGASVTCTQGSIVTKGSGSFLSSAPMIAPHGSISIHHGGDVDLTSDSRTDGLVVDISSTTNVTVVGEVKTEVYHVKSGGDYVQNVSISAQEASIEAARAKFLSDLYGENYTKIITQGLEADHAILGGGHTTEVRSYASSLQNTKIQGVQTDVQLGEGTLHNSSIEGQKTSVKMGHVKMSNSLLKGDQFLSVTGQSLDTVQSILSSSSPIGIKMAQYLGLQNTTLQGSAHIQTATLSTQNVHVQGDLRVEVSSATYEDVFHVAKTLSLLQGTHHLKGRVSAEHLMTRGYHVAFSGDTHVQGHADLGSERIAIGKGGSLSSEGTTFTNNVHDVDIEGTLRTQNANHLEAENAHFRLGQQSQLQSTTGSHFDTLSVKGRALTLERNLQLRSLQVKLKEQLSLLNARLDVGHVDITAGSARLHNSEIHTPENLILCLSRLSLERSLLETEKELYLSISGQLHGFDNVLKGRGGVYVSTGSANFGATVEGKKAEFKATGDAFLHLKADVKENLDIEAGGNLSTSGASKAGQSIFQKAGGNATLGMIAEAQTLYNESGQLLSITSPQIAVERITNKGAHVDLLSSQTAHRIVVETGDDGKIQVTGELKAVPVKLPNGETVSLIEFIGGVLCGSGVIAAESVKLQVKEVYGKEQGQALNMNVLQAFVQNASTTALQDFHVAINIAGAGTVYVMAQGKSLVIDVPSSYHANSNTQVYVDSAQFNAATKLSGAGLGIHATKEVGFRDDVISSANLTVSAGGSIGMRAKQKVREAKADFFSVFGSIFGLASPTSLPEKEGITLEAVNLTLSSEEDIELEGTRFKVQEQLRMFSQRDTLFKAVEEQERLRNGLSKKSYTDVEMVAKELLIESEGRVDGIFHGETTGDARIYAKEGLSSSGRQVSYVARNETRESGFFFTKTERFYETATDTYSTSLVSHHGRVNISSSNGGIDLQGAKIVGALAGQLVSEGNIDISPLLFTNTSSYSSSDWGGLSRHSSNLSRQSADSAVVMAGRGRDGGDGDDPDDANVRNVNILSNQKLNADGAQVLGDHVYMRGREGFSFQSIILQNAARYESEVFGISSGFVGPNVQEHLHNIGENLQKSSVVGAGGAALKAISDLKAGTGKVKDATSNLAQGNLMGGLGALGLGRVTIGFTKTRHDSQWSEMHAGMLEAKTFVAESDETLHMRGTSQKVSEETTFKAKGIELGDVKGYHHSSSVTASM